MWVLCPSLGIDQDCYFWLQLGSNEIIAGFLDNYVSLVFQIGSMGPMWDLSASCRLYYAVIRLTDYLIDYLSLNTSRETSQN